MATITICDFRDEKGKPCETRAEVTASLRWSDKNWQIDLCDVHSKSITANAREAEPERPYSTAVTRLPRAEPKQRKAQEQLISDPTDMKECRRWLEFNGDLTAGSRGRIKQELQAKWLEAGSPVEVADGTFKPAAS